MKLTKPTSGLGHSTCLRLIDEFLYTHPQFTTLHLIITTRSPTKSSQTLSQLHAHVSKAAKAADKKFPGIGALVSKRVKLSAEVVDLTRLRGVRDCALRLFHGAGSQDGAEGEGSSGRVRALDAIILNAGYGAWASIDWPRAIYTILTDLPQSLTWPTFKIPEAPGRLTKPQISRYTSQDSTTSKDEISGHDWRDEPPLGEIFAANLFGHYMLSHYLMPLLHRGNHGSGGRIIYLSSLEAYASDFKVDDIQSLTVPNAYEATKRLTDILTLTSGLQSTRSFVSSYLNPKSSGQDAAQSSQQGMKSESSEPTIYVAHPGICATSIFPLPYILTLVMNLAFYVARWCGSVWHTCDSYKGACSVVWLALAERKTLDRLDGCGDGERERFRSREGRRETPRILKKGKWGTATDPLGNERVERTEVEGWGYDGTKSGTELTPVKPPSDLQTSNPKSKEKMSDDQAYSGESTTFTIRKGRKRGAKELTTHEREKFEEVGVQCWREMEALREEWEWRIEES